MSPTLFYATETGRANPVPTVFHSDPANVGRRELPPALLHGATGAAAGPHNTSKSGGLYGTVAAHIGWKNHTDPRYKQNPFDFDNLRALDPNVTVAVYATCTALVIAILAGHRAFPRKCRAGDLAFDSAHYINDTHSPKFLSSRLGLTLL